MFKFLDLEPESFGLDMSDLSLKVVRLKKKGRFFRLASWGEAKLKKGLIEEGEIKDEDELSNELKKVTQKVKGEKLDTRNAIVSLPEKKSFLQIIKMPKMDDKDLKTAVPFEAENYIPLPIDNAYIDYGVISENNSGGINVLVASAPKNIIDAHLLCLKKAGLTTYAMEVESQSIIRSVIKEEFSNEPVFVVDFGESTTSIIIFYKRSIILTASLSLSSSLLTERIASGLEVNVAEAEKIKIRYGLDDKTKESRMAAKSMSPVLKDLAGQIDKYINYYKDHGEGKRVKKILLCGRGANLKGLPGFLSSELKLRIEIANPWINILPANLKEVPELPFKESIGYATALGLALRGIKNL